MGRCCEEDFICKPGCNENNFIYKPIKTKRCSRCGNLLENPSFEAGLTGWVTNNVSASVEKPFEGTATARMGQTAPSMFQDVLLNKNCRKPLLLSFEILASIIELNVLVGNLIVEVLWLNDEGEIIGTGLRTFIPEGITSISENRLTFVEITDLPPSDAAAARIQFSKGSTDTDDNSKNLLDIDQVILAPIDSINLVKNSGFQLALKNWNATDTTAQFIGVYEGTGMAELNPNGIIYQNIPINQLPRHSRFLLSFATAGGVDAGSLRAQVIWLDKFGFPVGTGLDLLINGAVIEDQQNYTTYVDITNEAPRNAVTAQIKFINTDSTFEIDKVIFASVMSTNLLQNPSFENDLTLNPWIGEGANVVQTDESYEGNRLVRINGDGGFISQEVPVEATHCYLLNFGYEPDTSRDFGNLLAEVYWLDRNAQEIGIGLSIIIGQNAAIVPGRWLTYLGVTEPAPENAVRAMVQFSKSFVNSTSFTTVDIDKVVFARLV